MTSSPVPFSHCVRMILGKLVKGFVAGDGNVGMKCRGVYRFLKRAAVVVRDLIFEAGDKDEAGLGVRGLKSA